MELMVHVSTCGEKSYFGFSARLEIDYDKFARLSVDEIAEGKDCFDDINFADIENNAELDWDYIRSIGVNDDIECILGEAFWEMMDYDKPDKDIMYLLEALPEYPSLKEMDDEKLKELVYEFVKKTYITTKVTYEIDDIDVTEKVGHCIGKWDEVIFHYFTDDVVHAVKKGLHTIKAISNINTLIERLSLIDKDWQRIIYDKTGVILTERLYLVSNCGCVYLDDDMRCYFEDDDAIEYTFEDCSINSIDDAISYIKVMKNILDRLQDVSYGKFTKSEFFWAILERILLRSENFDELGQQLWVLFSIGKYEQYVDLLMWIDVCGYFNIWLDITEEPTLDEALMMLVSQLNESADVQDWLPHQKIFDVKYSVPNTYEELKALCSKGTVFAREYI